jgi:tetratricopeptide (TPR) repeat protein
MRTARTWSGFRKVNFILLAVLLAALLALPSAARPAAAQDSALKDGPAPPYTEPPPSPAPAQPTFDPLRATKSLEVGAFYMKRGNYDAAIERFQDATHFQPNLARSYLLLGEAYEHNGDVDNALAAYRKYLSVFRNAPDQEKILKRIEKLESQSGHAQPKQKSD